MLTNNTKIVNERKVYPSIIDKILSGDNNDFKQDIPPLNTKTLADVIIDLSDETNLFWLVSQIKEGEITNAN